VISNLKKSNLDRKDAVFISRIQLWQNTAGAERLRTVTSGIEFDQNLNGCWVRRGSTAHSLALLLGFEPYDNERPIEDGTYDRTGRIL